MPEYDLSTRTAFDHPIRLHNANIQNIMSVRSALAGHAQQLRDFLFDDYPLTKARMSYKDYQRDAVGYWQGLQTTSPDPVRQVFDGSLNAYESRTCFDPWDGRWKGKWHGGGQSWGQRHVWDVTQPYNGTIGGSPAAQFIQPVTQRTTTPGLGEYVGGGDLDAAWQNATVNLAINVYDAQRGVTGWVSRREGSDGPKEVPHIGLLLNPHTLIWIAQFRPPTNVIMSLDEDFLMFFEWVLPAQNIYGIHGRRFRIRNGIIHPDKMEGWSEYARALAPPVQQPPQPAPQPTTAPRPQRKRIMVPSGNGGVKWPG